MFEFLSRYFFYPLWAWREKSCRVTRYKELLRLQWEKPEKLKKAQLNKLNRLLQHANKTSPFYKALFANNNIEVTDITNLDDFKKIPITKKSELQQDQSAFISSTYQIQNLASAKTGGSTGHSLQLYFDDPCLQMRNAAAMRSDSWALRFPGTKTAALWGNPVPPKGLKTKLRSLLHDRIFVLDTMKMDPDSIESFVSEWHKKKGKIIFGHAHSIFLLAEQLLKTKNTSIKPSGIITTSMMLPAHERKIIEHCFNCKVTDRYGCEEVGLIASECEEHDGMHLNTDDLIIEFVDADGQAVKLGEMGRILVTDLNNYGMPLIRYEVGDWGVPSDKQCKCGRGLPMMEKLIGRTADFLKKQDGSQVAGISLIERTLTAFNGIAQLQLVQNSITNIEINLVKKDNADPNTETALIQELKSVFGNETEFTVNLLSAIPQEPNGKYRFSICRI